MEGDGPTLILNVWYKSPKKLSIILLEEWPAVSYTPSPFLGELSENPQDNEAYSLFGSLTFSFNLL